MPRRGTIKFVSGYLIPSLNSKRFGSSLKWLDKNKRIFQIDWNHRSGQKWTEKAASVFVEWDKAKGHYNPAIKTYFTQSKQRFRALLYKLVSQGQLSEVKQNSKAIRIYVIAEQQKRRKQSLCESSENESEEKMFYPVDFDETSQNLPSLTRRKVSADHCVNISEDHDYVQPFNMPEEILDYTQELMNLNHDPSLIPPLYDTNEPVSQTTDKNSLQRRHTCTLENIVNSMDLLILKSVVDYQEERFFDLDRLLRSDENQWITE